MSCNGHKNWNHWNVSLWLDNEEWLYRMKRSLVRCSTMTRDQAARAMVRRLRDDYGITHTPDGARYTFSSVRAAMRHEH